jgi:hypothetical protein
MTGISKRIVNYLTKEKGGREVERKEETTKLSARGNRHNI